MCVRVCVCVRESLHPGLYKPSLSLLSAVAPPLVALLGDGELDTLALGQRDLGLGALANDEDVGETGRGQQGDRHRADGASSTSLT
jgi:hypothetical protein